MISHEQATRLQRQASAFGRTRNPLNQLIDGTRIVVAGPQILAVPAIWTFHEFLLSYAQSKLGGDWIANNQDHPLIVHATKGFAGIRIIRAANGEFSSPMNGDLLAFLSFSYDLFTVSDNAHVQNILLHRLKNVDQYQGARYELFVSASLLRAGFKIAFEDECDSSTSHCEFTATSKRTGRSFSVEAKSRHRKLMGADTQRPSTAGIYRLLQKALTKSARHDRLIFADVNLPSDHEPLFQQAWHKEVVASLNGLEKNQKVDDPWPQAIVCFTNRKTSPWPTDQAGSRSTVLLTAINHPLFMDKMPGLVEREYPELGPLFQALNELSHPPRHFFGQ